MGETSRIILALKRGLRSRGITYAMLARRISLSEPSVKRILSRGSLSLPRLERICEAAGLSMEEIMRPVPIPTDAPRWGLCDGIHRDDHEFVPA